MPFTSPDLVRAHIANANFGDADMRNSRIILSGTSPVNLPHAGLREGSVSVKARRGNDPVRLSETLNDGWVILNHANLIEGTVAVAADSSLGTIYIENLDFIVDYAGGRIKRIDTGAIANGQQIYVWYGHYHIYAEGDDYMVDHAAGQITRRSSGAIADGQDVLVDYSISLGSVSDAVIEQAIIESGEAVLRLVNESHHESPSPGLVIGATHLAVAMLSRMRSVSVLADQTLNPAVARSAAQIWLELASQYDRSSHAFLSQYANPVNPRTALKRA